MENLFENWFLFGFFAFMITYFLGYVPYWFNREKRYPSVIFMIVVLLLCLLLGKFAFWIGLGMVIANIDELEEWIRRK